MPREGGRAGAWVLAAALAAAGGCSALRWEGFREKPPAEPGATQVRVKEDPRSPAEWEGRLPAVPEGFDTLYYSDLGPDSVDVSGYPTQQRFNYGIFARSCSQCHTLARAVNAPAAGRRLWGFYLKVMRRRAGYAAAQPIGDEEARRILDFLEHDSRVRKVERANEFDALTEELRRRFEPLLERRMRRLEPR